MPIGGEVVGPGISSSSTGGGGGSGTVTSVSVVSANGLAGTVANSTTAAAITLSTSVTGVLKGNGTAVSAAVSGTDYSAGTAALATGILKSTTTTGVLSIAVAGTDYIAGPLTGDVTTSGNAATLVGTANVESIIRANTLNQMAAPTSSLSINGQALTSWLFTVSTITADPNPGVSATYYRCNYGSSGNFTLPSSSVSTGTWIRIKNIAANTITLQGTIDGQSNSFTLTQYQAVMVIYNGTNWDAM